MIILNWRKSNPKGRVQRGIKKRRGIRVKTGMRGGRWETGKLDRGKNLEVGVENRIETEKEKERNREKRKGKSRGGGKEKVGIKIKIDKEKGRKYL